MFYDPVVGRWTSVDLWAENDASYSPFIYGFNNPIKFTDPDGRWPDEDGPNIIETLRAGVDMMVLMPLSTMSPRLQRSGAAAGYPAGTKIPPTKVNVIRPSN